MALLSPRIIQEKLPLSIKQKEWLGNRRETLRNLVTGKDPRLALILGPCSIHDLSSALEYGRRVKALSEKVESTYVCIMRVYIEKPRTVTGWKGLVYDPHLDGSNDLQTGLFWARELFLTLTDLGVPIATEILNPLLLPYVEDLVAWGFIGARTSASQLHREIASKVSFPVGFKNSPEGDIESAIHAMIAASAPHSFPHINKEGVLEIAESEGNRSTHIVLRGSKTSTNYDAHSIGETLNHLHQKGLNTRVLVDCSHGNCQKNPQRQKEVFLSILDQFERGNRSILGMMLESHLEEGHQHLSESPSTLHYGLSITDPCIGWPETETLVRSSSERLSSSKLMRLTQS